MKTFLSSALVIGIASGAAALALFTRGLYANFSIGREVSLWENTMETHDYYEFLQISPNAEPETIHRVSFASIFSLTSRGIQNVVYRRLLRFVVSIAGLCKRTRFASCSTHQIRLVLEKFVDQRMRHRSP
jgi:hypothetical protein